MEGLGAPRLETWRVFLDVNSDEYQAVLFRSPSRRKMLDIIRRCWVTDGKCYTAERARTHRHGQLQVTTQGLILPIKIPACLSLVRVKQKSEELHLCLALLYAESEHASMRSSGPA